MDTVALDCESRTADPYGLQVPDGWTVDVGSACVTYEGPDSTVRVTITELARNLTLYWWVDVYARDASGEWTRREAGPETTYRDPAMAADHAQELVDAAVGGEDFSTYSEAETPHTACRD